MKQIARLMYKKYNEDAALQKRVNDSNEPYRCLIWESNIFSKDFLENWLDPEISHPNCNDDNKIQKQYVKILEELENQFCS